MLSRLAIVVGSCLFAVPATVPAPGGAPQAPTSDRAVPAPVQPGDARTPIKDYTDTGPLGLMITYRCRPAERPAFRRYLQAEALPRLEGYKKEGWLREYEVFHNWYVDDKTWDAAVLLRLRSWPDVVRWKAVERKLPGGLDARGLALATPLTTSSCDFAWENRGGAKGHDSSQSVFLLIPYKYKCLVKRYKEYVDGYVTPQLDGWIREQAMVSYRILLNRYPTGDRWGSLLLLEYKDVVAFGRRKHVKYKVREGLRKDPVWRFWSDIKRTLREEREPVITDLLTPIEKD